LPLQFPFLAPLIPRQRKALAAVDLIRQTTNDLIKKCKEMVDEEEMAAAAAASAAGGEYLNEGVLVVGGLCGEANWVGIGMRWPSAWGWCGFACFRL
jgi:hypothetical protein